MHFLEEFILLVFGLDAAIISISYGTKDLAQDFRLKYFLGSCFTVLCSYLRLILKNEANEQLLLEVSHNFFYKHSRCLLNNIYVAEKTLYISLLVGTWKS